MGPVAQWQEHPASIRKVPGSNPSWIPEFSAEFFLSPITCIRDTCIADVAGVGDHRKVLPGNICAAQAGWVQIYYWLSVVPIHFHHSPIQVDLVGEVSCYGRLRLQSLHYLVLPGSASNR